MSVIQPTPALMELNQALASRPTNRLTPEAARAQVEEHREEAETAFYRHPKFARIARRQQWIDPKPEPQLLPPPIRPQNPQPHVWRRLARGPYYLPTLSASNDEAPAISSPPNLHRS